MARTSPLMLMLTSLASVAAQQANSLATIQLSVAEGSGYVLEQTKDLLFGRGKASNWGADVAFNAEHTQAKISFWDSDGDAFITVRSAKSDGGACVFDAQILGSLPRAVLFQREGFACGLTAVKSSAEFGEWVVESTGETTSCDWSGRSCDPVVPAAPKANALATIQLSVAQGSGYVLEQTKDLLFGRGKASNWGADVAFNAERTQAKISFWDSDGDAFITVRSAKADGGACVFDAQILGSLPRAVLFQREGFACGLTAVKSTAEFGEWVVESTGETTSCDWSGTSCAPVVPAAPKANTLATIQLSVAEGSGYVLEQTKDLLFGRGKASNWGADVVFSAERTQAKISFWDSDGDAFITVRSAKSDEGACVFDAQILGSLPRAVLFQREGFACGLTAVKSTAEFGEWVVESTGEKTSCDWSGTSCDPVVPAAPKANTLATIQLSVAEGSGYVLEQTKDLLFGRGEASNWGADVAFNAERTQAKISFWDSDGDAFITVRSAKADGGACVFDAQILGSLPRAVLFQREAFACGLTAVKSSTEFGEWVVESTGETSSCDWSGTSCDPVSPHVEVIV